MLASETSTRLKDTPLAPFFLGIAALVVVGMLAVVMMTPDSLVDAIKGEPTFAEKLIARQVKADVLFDTTMATVRRGDWKQAHAEYTAAIDALENMHRTPGGKSVPLRKGYTVQNWLDDRHEALRKALDLQIPVMVDRVIAKEVTVVEARALVGLFQGKDFVGLLARLNKDLEQQSAQRVAESRRMLRVVLQVPAHMREPIRQAIKTQWRQFGYFDLTFDEPSGVSEQVATAKTLLIRVHLDFHAVSGTDPDEGIDEIVSIPRRVTVGFKMESRSIVKTSWDELPTITATAEIPAVLSRTSDAEDRYVLAIKQLEINQAAIATELAEKLAKLPEFRLFPGVDLTAPIVDEAGEANTERAMAMALLEPYRFQSVFRDAIERKHTPTLVACTLVALQLRSDEFDELLPAALKLLPMEQEKPVLAAIFRRGMSLDYPLILVYARCVSDESAMEAYRYLLANYESTELFADVLGDVGKRSPTFARDLSSEWLVQAPLDVLPQALTLLEDAGPDLRDNIIRRLSGRERWQVLDLALVRYYDRLRPGQREAILERYTYDSAAHGAEGLQVLIAALATAETKEREGLVRALVRNSRQADCWRAIRRSVESDTPPAAADELRTALLREALQAVPDDARAFLVSELSRLQAQLTGAATAPSSVRDMRDLCVQKILIDLPGKPENVKLIADFVAANSDDVSLLRTVLGALETACFEQNWRWQADGVDAIINRAVAHDDPQMRRAAYKLWVHAATAIPTGPYRDRLREVAQRETNPALVDYLQRELNRGQ